jgi:putative hydrolase of the HAD superfamily
MTAMRPPPTRAVLLDALGTLVRLEPPAPRLQAELARLGHQVDPDLAERAFAAEIAYYLEHHTEAFDPSSLAELRNRCAAVIRDVLGVPELDHAGARRAMLDSIRFAPYPDAGPALGELRARGLRLVVASNWDCSLPHVLDGAGLGGLLDGVVTSAATGARKPDPALFVAALRLAGCEAGEALHVGDSPVNDVDGARSAGIRAVLLSRDGSAAPPTGVEAIASLAELPRRAGAAPVT